MGGSWPRYIIDVLTEQLVREVFGLADCRIVLDPIAATPMVCDHAL
jgi:hypothetical protein